MAKLFKRKAPKNNRRLVVKAGAQYIDPTFTLTQGDVDEVLKNANLVRSDLLNLLYDDEIFGCTSRRMTAVLGNSWHIEGDSTDWLYKAIASIHEAAVRSMLQAVWIGSSIGELIYRVNDEGVITIDKIAPRRVEAFRQTKDGLVWKSQGGTEVKVVPEKVLVSGVNVNDDNPYGDALLSRVYWAWFNKNYGEQFWSKYAERHASPLTVIKSAINMANREESQDELAMLAAAVASAVAAGTVALDNDDVIEFIEANGDGEAHAKFVRHQVQRIQKTIIGRVLTPDLNNGAGSRAAQETDDSFYQDITESDLSFCERGMNHIINCLLTVNGIDANDIYFVYDRETTIDESRWKRDVALLGTGNIVFTEQYYLDNYGLEAEHFIVQQKEQQSMTASLARQRLTPAAQEVEDNIIATLDDMPVLLATEDVQELIKESNNEADLIRRLSLLYDDNDSSQFEGWLEQALAMAHAQGFYHADKGKF